MTGKRTYKTLTTKQTAKVKSYTKKGKTQAQIAKLLGVSKQRVSTAQAKAGVGKRVASPFWKDVAKFKELTGYSHKESTKLTKLSPKWKERYYKTTGRRRVTKDDMDKDILAKVREAFKSITKRDMTAYKRGEKGEAYFEFDGTEYVYLGEK